MLALLLAAHIATSGGATSGGAAPAAAAAGPKPTDDRMRTVIMGLVPRRGVDDTKLAAALTDVIQGVYAGDTRRIVIGRDDIMRVLDLEATKQTMGCDSDKCLAEVGQALDAQRIVTGSLDKLGDGYMVTMSEIDAKSLEPIGRQQDRVKNDENALVDTVSRLAKALLEMSGSASVATHVLANAGSIDVQSDPRGAKIVVGGTDMGTTPTKIDNLGTGNQKLRLIRDDYEPVEVEVPVYPGGVTKVSAEMRILRALAEKNLEARQAAWRDKSQWHQVGAWTKVGAGGVVGLAGAGYGVANIGKGGLVPGVVVGAIGGGVLAWGVIDLLNPPAPPVPEWEVERKVTVTPPSGQGTASIKVLQEAAAKPRSE